MVVFLLLRISKTLIIFGLSNEIKHKSYFMVVFANNTAIAPRMHKTFKGLVYRDRPFLIE